MASASAGPSLRNIVADAMQPTADLTVIRCMLPGPLWHKTVVVKGSWHSSLCGYEVELTVGGGKQVNECTLFVDVHTKNAVRPFALAATYLGGSTASKGVEDGASEILEAVRTTPVTKRFKSLFENNGVTTYCSLMILTAESKPKQPPPIETLTIVIHNPSTWFSSTPAWHPPTSLFDRPTDVTFRLADKALYAPSSLFADESVLGQKVKEARSNAAGSSVAARVSKKRKMESPAQALEGSVEVAIDTHSSSAFRAYLGYLVAGGRPCFANLDGAAAETDDDKPADDGFGGKDTALGDEPTLVCARELYAVLDEYEDDDHELKDACLTHLSRSYTVSNIARQAFLDPAFLMAHDHVADGIVHFVARHHDAVRRSPEWKKELRKNLSARSSLGGSSHVEVEIARWPGLLLSKIDLAVSELP